MNDIELKRKRIETVVKILALLVVGFFVAPFVFISIKGLAGLAIAFILSLVVINFIPWFAAKLTNWKLKALKAEANANPIETLQNDYISRRTALGSFRDSIRDFNSQIGIFKEKLVGFKEKYPKDSDKFDAQLNQMKQLLKLRENKYVEAVGNLDAYEMEIQKASAIWDMALAAAEMSKAAGVDTEEFYAKIQVETALDSVQKSLNSAFADLEVCLLDEQGKKPTLPTTSPDKVIAIDSKESRKPLTLDLDPV